MGLQLHASIFLWNRGLVNGPLGHLTDSVLQLDGSGEEPAGGGRLGRGGGILLAAGGLLPCHTV